MAEDTPNATSSAVPPPPAQVTTVSAVPGTAAGGNAAPIPVATISVATTQGTTVPVATVLIATAPQAAAPATGTPAASALKEKPAAQGAHEDTAPHKHSGLFALIIVIVLVVIGGVIGFLIYKHMKKPPPKAPPPITVSVTNAVRGNIDETVWTLGTVTPVYTAMISPRVDGQLVKVNFTEGQMVTTNDLLAEIDPGPYQAMVTQAEGQLARDKAQLEGAKIDLGRFQEAYGKGYGTNLHAVPKQQVDDQQALVHQDEGTVKVDEGQVANANVQLAYCFIHAPIAGRAGLRQVDPGNVVHGASTNAIVTIAQLQPITVVFSPGEDFLPAIQRQLQEGHPMTVEAWDRDQKQKLATGTFLTMDSLIDTGTGTIKIKSLFENRETELFPNQFVNAKLIVDTLSNVTLIPTAAIQRNPQGAFVYLTTNKQMTITNQGVAVQTNVTVVVMHTITEGVKEDDVTAVEGIEPGEVIVTDNFNKLGDGARVNVRQPGEDQKGGPPGGKKKGGKKDKEKAQENAP